METIDDEGKDKDFVAPSNETKVEKEYQPGKKIKFVARGDIYYTQGQLVRVKDGRVGQVSSWEMIEDWLKKKAEYPWDDPSITRKGKKFTNPKFTVSFVDNSQEVYGPLIDLPEPVYFGQLSGNRLNSEEDFYELSRIELRGHVYNLGDLVSFGRAVGRLAMITPGTTKEEASVAVVATREHGKSGDRFVWKINASEIDYVDYDEKGAIKRNPDNTIFKPTLSKE